MLRILDVQKLAIANPANQLPQVYRKTNSEWKSFSGCAVTLQTQSCHTNCSCKAGWWNVIRVSLSRCILPWSQNNFRGSLRPRLHSVNPTKVSIPIPLNQVVLWILSHQRPAALLIRQHQRADIAAAMRTSLTHDQSFNRCIAAVFVCLICSHWSRRLFSVMWVFHLISWLCEIEPVRGQNMTSRCHWGRENPRRRMCLKNAR